MPITGQAYNHVSMKQHNAQLVMKLIYDSGAISRSAIAEKTGLTRATITNIVSELIDIGLVREGGFFSSGVGRRKIALEFNPYWRYVVGIDWNRGYRSVAVTDLLGTVIAKQMYRSGSTSLESTCDSIIQMVEEVITASRVPSDKLLGIGLAVPHPVTTLERTILSGSGDGETKEALIYQGISEHFDLPVYMSNNANAAAMGEKMLGGCKHIDNFIYVDISTGIGSGIIIDGKLYEGRDCIAGEIGHTTVDVNGPVCQCGNVGCLEMFASISGILSRAQSLLGNPGHATRTDERDLRAFQTLVQNHDEAALQIIDNAVRYLSSGFVNLVNLFNPQRIVIGGHILDIWDDIGSKLVNEVRRRALTDAAQMLEILPSTYGVDSILMGSVTLVLDELFRGATDSGMLESGTVIS